MGYLDLGLGQRTAPVRGSSAGMGRGCAEALAAAGVHVVLKGRTESALVAAAEEIRHKTPALAWTISWRMCKTRTVGCGSSRNARSPTF